MSSPITIEILRLEGFRAYLQPQIINLYRGKIPLSLAVFAPNAKGKSSLVDAFEFYFSDDATLNRLGVRAAERNAGRGALEHVDAQAKGFKSEVYLSFRAGNEIFDDKRIVISQGSPLPNAAQRVLKNLLLPFIIRGHELRSFVEQKTSEERYKEISAWFGLNSLLEIQMNLRALRKQVKQKIDSKTERQERLRDLSRITSNAVINWDEVSVCRWLTDDVATKLDKELIFTAINETDKAYQELKKRKIVEDENLGIASLKRFLIQIDGLYKEPIKEGEGPTGAIVAFEASIVSYATAVTKEFEERTKASQTVFNDIWKAAKTVFENKDIILETCPVCDTELSTTPHGSREATRVNVEAKLSDLTEYHMAETTLKTAGKTLINAFHSLIQNLENMISNIKGTCYAKEIKEIEAYQQAIALWKTGDESPNSTGVLIELSNLHKTINAEKEYIEAQQGDYTYVGALKIADDLIKLSSDLKRIDQIKAELVNLHEQLNQQALFINKAIVAHTQKLIVNLMNDVNTLYKEIQGSVADAPPIRLELPDEADTNQQRIQLLIDFANNRKGVVPSGYLSDSQIHTLALCLRLAAIRLFNKQVPIIVLDDIVTSYDAYHRKNIASMLAKHFNDFQIILVTHDERFFMLLQDHLPQNAWNFRRINDIKPEFGPCFHDHRTPDENILSKLEKGESVANEIRQVEEEWLLDICRDFRVKVIIRPIERPYKYERSELALALASFLKNVGLVPPKIPGIANPFLVSLQKGDVENFGSHFSDNPNESDSFGDEKTRWEEFKAFRDLFVCPKCGMKRFIRPEPLKTPVCKKCETPFAFKVLSDGEVTYRGDNE